MEKWAERQRKSGQGDAGGAGDCLEGERGRLDADTGLNVALKGASGFG